MALCFYQDNHCRCPLQKRPAAGTRNVSGSGPMQQIGPLLALFRLPSKNLNVAVWFTNFYRHCVDAGVEPPLRVFLYEGE